MCNQLASAKTEKLIVTDASGLLGSKIVKLAKKNTTELYLCATMCAVEKA